VLFRDHHNSACTNPTPPHLVLCSPLVALADELEG
jgi:hypothetical protein